MVEKTCKICKKLFNVIDSRKHTAIYCSCSCRQEALKGATNTVCGVCGKEFHLKKSHKLNENYCSMACKNKSASIKSAGKGNHQYGLKGDLNASFKGLITVRKNNKNYYEHIYFPSHPLADRYGRILNHRYIVEQNKDLFNADLFENKNGFYYLPLMYEVHHKDENSMNNDVSNLQILTKSEHVKLHRLRKCIQRNPINGRIIGVYKSDKLLETPERKLNEDN